MKSSFRFDLFDHILKEKYEIARTFANLLIINIIDYNTSKVIHTSSMYMNARSCLEIGPIASEAENRCADTRMLCAPYYSPVP